MDRLNLPRLTRNELARSRLAFLSDALVIAPHEWKKLLSLVKNREDPAAKDNPRYEEFIGVISIFSEEFSKISHMLKPHPGSKEILELMANELMKSSEKYERIAGNSILYSLNNICKGSRK
jgi:hypothetical protein